MNKYRYSGVTDKNGTEIEAGHILRDNWQGLLYEVSFKNGSFILTSTGTYDDNGKQSISHILKGRTSQIYDNIQSFPKRYEIYKESVLDAKA